MQQYAPLHAPTPAWGPASHDAAAIYDTPALGSNTNNMNITEPDMDAWPIGPGLRLGLDMAGDWAGTATVFDASYGIPALDMISVDLTALPPPPPGWPDFDMLQLDPTTTNMDPDVGGSISVATPSQGTCTASPSRSAKSPPKIGRPGASRVSKPTSTKGAPKKPPPPKNRHARGPTKQMDEVNAIPLPRLPQPKRVVDPLDEPEPESPPGTPSPDVSPEACPPGVLPSAHLPAHPYPHPHPLLPTEDGTLLTLRQAGWRYTDILDRFGAHFGPRITSNALVKRSQKLHALYGAALTAAVNRALPQAMAVTEREMAQMGLTGPSVSERRSIEHGIAWAISGRMHLQRYETPEREAQSDVRRDQQRRIGDTFEDWMTKNPHGAAGYIAKVKNFG